VKYGNDIGAGAVAGIAFGITIARRILVNIKFSIGAAADTALLQVADGSFVQRKFTGLLFFHISKDNR
jgi:hypothetical protein